MRKSAFFIILFFVTMLAGSAPAQPGPGKVMMSKKNQFGQIKVTQRPDGSTRDLFIDGAHVGWTGDGSARRAHFPLLLSKKSGKVLVLGAGTGASIMSVITHRAVRVDSVSTSPAMMEAMHWFNPDNKGAYEDNRVIHFYDKPAEWMGYAEDKYDVIIAGQHAVGPASSMTPPNEENLGKIKSLLTPEGVAGILIPLFKYENAELRSALAAASKVFNQVTLWNMDVNPAHSWLLILGSDSQSQVEFKTVKNKLGIIAYGGDMMERTDAASFLSFYVTDGKKADWTKKPAGTGKSAGSKGPVKHPGARDSERSAENYKYINSFRSPAGDFIKADDAQRKVLAAYYASRTKLIAGRLTGLGGRAKDEVAFYREAEKSAPHDPHIAKAYLMVGQAFYRSNLLGAAAQILELAKKVDPENAEIRFYLGKSYEKMNKHVEATREFKKLIEINPTFFQRVIVNK